MKRRTFGMPMVIKSIVAAFAVSVIFHAVPAAAQVRAGEVRPGSALTVEVETETLDLGEVVVSETRPELEEIAPNHGVEVLTRDEIAELPADTLPELLEYIRGADVRRRGPGGIQADVGIRGGGFERAAVLLNGVRMNDPQTGHHNMDIPVNLGDVERIEIMKGAGAHLFGPGAMAGAINIVTSGGGKRRVEAETGGGKFGLRKAAASYTDDVVRISAGRETSDGFRFDTDYENTTIDIEGGKKGGPGVLLGWNRKDFGANDYYVAGWPSREETRTGFFNLDYSESGADGGGLRADAYSRRHYDRFECSVLNPALCANTHRTYRRGADFERRFPVGGNRGFLTAGLLAERDRMDSSNMGRRASAHSAASARYDAEVSERLRIDAGVRADKHAGYPDRWSWSAGAGYRAGGGVRLRVNAGRSYRVPSFTELFYSDPAHVSFTGLAPETAFSYEAALETDAGRADFEMSFHSMEVRGLIDWTRASAAAPWRIGNTPEVRFSGASAGVKYRVSERFTWALSYDYLEIRLGGQLQYKYTGEKPAGAARARLTWKPGGGYSLSAGATYEKMKMKKSTAVTDVQLKKGFSGGEYYLRIGNLFDRDYEDVSGTPMPGMTAAAGVKLAL